MAKPRVFAFDFDGVMTKYKGFRGEGETDAPNLEVVEAIRELKRRGHTILIHSTRGAELLRAYCAEHDIPVDYFNERPDKFGQNRGKPIAHVYVDDRALCYRGQKADELVEEIENFQTHWERES